MSAEQPERRENPIHVVPDLEPWRSGIDTRGRDAIVVGPGGVFVVRSDELVTYARPAYRSDLREILGVSGLLRSGWGGVQLRYRVPFDLLLQSVTFFREAWKRYQTEEILLLFLYYDEGRYTLHHPRILSASGERVECEIPDAPDGAVRFGDFHSHGSHREAHHSLEDRDTDVKSPGIHIIVGNVDAPLPTLHCVCSDGRHCFPVCPWDVFAAPTLPGCPQEWFDDHAPRRAGATPRTPVPESPPPPPKKEWWHPFA